jgi:hypothetical protein
MDTLRADERLHAEITLAVDGIPVPPGSNQLRRSRGDTSRRPMFLVAAALAGVLAVTAGSLAALRVARDGSTASAEIASPTTGRPTPPPGYTTPPGPSRYQVRTAAEVLAGMASDPFVTGNSASWDPKSLGTPIYVRALRASDQDLWLVPEVNQGKVVAVIVVSVGKDGLGAAGIKAGGPISNGAPNLTVPPLSEDRAWEIAGPMLTNRGTAELVWMLVDPRSGFLVQEIRPMWRLTSRAGAVAYVTSDGQLVSEPQVKALL